MLVRLLLAVVVAIAAALPVRAQAMLGIDEPADRLMADALASPQGEALLETFAANVRKAGDPSCLQAKALDGAALVAGGRALLHRRGAQMLQLIDEDIDRAAFQAALSESGEPGAVAELEKLRGESNVKALMAIERPATLARLLAVVLEQFDRHVLIARINLDAVAPTARGEPDPIKDDLIEAAEVAAQKYMDEHPSPQIDRYLELVDVLSAAWSKGFSRQAVAKLGPMAHFAGVEGDLAELCVGRRQRQP
jgi:hypothetical protein